MNKTLHSAEYKKLTDWLTAERRSQGLSMRELAKRMNISHSFVGKVEQAERRLDVVEYVKYCNALDISPIDGIKLISKKLQGLKSGGK